MAIGLDHFSTVGDWRPFGHAVCRFVASSGRLAGLARNGAFGVTGRKHAVLGLRHLSLSASGRHARRYPPLSNGSTGTEYLSVPDNPYPLRAVAVARYGL